MRKQVARSGCSIVSCGVKETIVKSTAEIRDPIHVIRTGFRPDEEKIIGSRAFQRLRYVHQLALTYLVYPGATHRRFEHCLGVMEVAKSNSTTESRDPQRSTTNLCGSSFRERKVTCEAMSTGARCYVAPLCATT